MTKEEALKSFEEENKDFEKTFERYGYQMSPEEVSAVKEAIERNKIAISALSTDGDLISRQVVLDLLQMKYSGKELYKAIYDLPPAENKGEPKTGHWIEHVEHCESIGAIPSGLGAYKWCSNCDCGIDVREWHRNDYNFCPKCGADMRGEADGK